MYINGLYNNISENIISNNFYGITLDPIWLDYKCNYNNIFQNKIIKNMHYGILQISSNINFILNNEISNNYIGLKLVKSNNNIIRKNNISKNEYGINLSESNYNLFSKNNFIDNFN